MLLLLANSHISHGRDASWPEGRHKTRNQDDPTLPVPPAQLPSSPPSNPSLYDVLPQKLQREDGGSVLRFSHSPNTWSVKHPGEMDIRVPSFFLDGTHNTLMGGRTDVPVLGFPRTGSPTAGSLGECNKPVTPLEPSFAPQSNSGNCIS